MCKGAAVFLSAVVSSALLAGAAVDRNGNQQSDVWEAMFSATNLPAATDADGDGFSNAAESIAGTDPYNPLSFPAISVASKSNTTWGSWAGKIYTIEAAAEPGGQWNVITNIPGTNHQMLAAIDLSNFTQKMFRVRVGDVFTDGSGLSDWEKLQTGLSLTSQFSNGTFDPQGNPVSDYSFITNRLAQQSMLSIIASDLTTVQPDPGSQASDPASFTILRGGFPFHSITSSVTLAGTAVEGLDYTNLPHAFSFPPGVISQTIIVTPLANTNLKAPATARMALQQGSGYSVGASSNASVVIYPASTPKGTGLNAQYFDSTNSTFTSGAQAVFSNTPLVGTRIETGVATNWSTNSPPPGMTNNTTFLVRWTGQVQPQYSEDYYFDVVISGGTRLWIGGQLVLDRWTNLSTEHISAPIPLQGGVRYDFLQEYFDVGGTSYVTTHWYSVSQPKQVIPQSRFYTTNVPAAPPAIVSSLSAYAILGYPFTNVVAANNGAGIISVGPMPPGLVFTASNRLISGVPTLAGKFQININATNGTGAADSILDLTVIDTGAVISREVWTDVPGIYVTNIPVDTSASSTGQLATLEGPSDFGDNYAERWRGYLTAPLSGNYYFWIAASDSAELWISNDGEHVNKVKRCWVAPSNNPAAPPPLGTGSRVWTNQPSQKSPWLSLTAGQRYYIEVLHKAGANTNDNIAIGWIRPDQTNSLPAEIVPGQVLSPFIPPIAFASSGTLFTATMLAQGAVVSYGLGTATLRLSADESAATLRLSYTNLNSAATGIHIHAEAYLTNSSAQLLFDVTAAAVQADGSYNWPINAAGTLSAADVAEIIKQGKAYIDIHTTNYPLGELRGNFTLAVGASKFVPPPPPPSWTDDHATSNGAVRFLTQATFGPSLADIASVQSLGYEAWIDDQFTRGPSYHLPTVLGMKSSDPNNFYTGSMMWNSWWEKAVTADDQLRQRVAFALSEIMVISDVGTLNGNARVQSHYYDTLLNNAFGNFRQLMEEVTLTPGMGLYLDMRGNAKGSITAGTHPNENYAREILQLFSVGLYRLWPDGTLVMNSKGDIVSTYDQKEILGYAAVFTGWNYWQPAQTNGRLPSNWYPSSNYTNFMVQVPSQHDRDAKRILDNVVLPAAAGNELASTNTSYDTYALNDLELALDAIFNNENTGPYICRQLIQRLVTSHPSRDYVHRVVQKFNDNGNGVRGDLRAVIKAILLDREARDPAMLGVATFGKQREPLLRVTALGRAFTPPPTLSGTWAQTGTAAIVVTFPAPHRMASGDTALFTFTNSAPNPVSGRYTVTSITTNTLAVSAANLLSGGTFIQSNGVVTVSYVNHYLLASNFAYIVFTNATMTSGVYQVATAINNAFTFPTPDTNLLRGSVLIPRVNGGFTVGYQNTSSNYIRFYTSQNHEMDVGSRFQAVFQSGVATDGVYVVSSNIDAKTIQVQTGSQTNDSNTPVYLFPLDPPVLNRSGTATLRYSTFNVGNTDSGSPSLLQTPLNSPTVFNFFFPDYKFAGALAAAGLTTPEFQLTSDSGLANINNFLGAGIGISGQSTTNGMCSFVNGSEAVTLDLGPWMTTNFASNTGVPALVDSFNSLLCAGQLSANAKTSIVAYVASTNLPYTTPTAAQIRDRVRAALHLIVTSPAFSIQK